MLETIKDLYRFYINHPIDGLIEVFPANANLDWEWKRQKGQIFFRKELSNELNFIGDDFKKLYKLDRSTYRCDKILIEIHRKCDEGFTVFWTGYLALIDGDFHVDRCKLKIKPRIEDEYTCLLSNWNKEKDYIEGVPSLPTIGITEGIINEAICTETYDHPIQAGAFNPQEQTPNTSCLDDPSYWSYGGVYTANIISYDNTILEETWEVTYIFFREEVTRPTQPFGVGWVEISTGLWVRPLTINNVGVNFKLNNGRNFGDVIQFLVSDCGLTFVSDFFNYNPDNTHPTNFAYDYAALYLHSLAIFQKSDLKPGQISQNATAVATKAKVKLKELLSDLNSLFNVFWSIDGNTFRIEHFTFYRQNQNMIDLTSNNRIKGLNKYKYLSEDLPRFEVWTMMDKTDKHPSLTIIEDFDAGNIEYIDNCSFEDDDANEAKFPASKITTNIEYITQDTEGNISSDGNVLVCTLNGSVMSSVGVVTGKQALNMPLSLGNLLYHLHRHGRPQRSGNMNGTDQAFFLIHPSREQDGISIPICCTDVDQFDPLHKIKTQLGWGFIDSAKLSDPKQVITFNLLHE
jgi:hypothetical protein